MMRCSMYVVYMLLCNDGTLYTGITTDVTRRLKEHNSGTHKSAKYTRARLPVTLVYTKIYPSRKEAAQEEYRIKQLSRKEKEQLIPSRNLSK